MKGPLISVILPVYNAEGYIRESVQSILNQSYQNFEIIIIDDASTDNTLKIIKGIQDARIQIIVKNKNSGYVDSLNLGIAKAKGCFIARMDADDISLSNRFEEQITYLINNPGIVAVASRIKIIDEFNNVIGDWKNDADAISVAEIKNYLPRGNCLCHPSMMIRRNVFNFYSYDNRQYGSEDWDLWLTLISDGFKIAKIDKTLLLYRVTNNSVSATIDNKLGVKGKAVRVQMVYLIKRFKTNNLNLYDIRVFIGLLFNFKAIIWGKLKRC